MTAQVTRKKPYRFIDLFAGIGGIRIACERNGGECVFTSEWDKYAQKTYQENFGEHPKGDITNIDEKDIPAHDFLNAGFPCQPFSTIGKREGFKHKTQGTLFFDVVRILKYHKTKMILLENVPGLVSHDNGNTIAVIEDVLENELGYKVFHQVVNAADYGVPQERKRIYIVGFFKDEYDDDLQFEWPEPESKHKYINEFLEEHPSGYGISKHLQNSYLFKKNDGRPQLIDKSSKIKVKTLVATYHKIQRLTGTFVKDGETGLRLLSENECKAIMGFPKSFKVPVSRTQMYRQFGNSVAIPVVEKIIFQILKTATKYKKGS
ncbi:MAG: DNA-cytosine methyltransferase (EC [uncultured Sulfurovum sp.]|uniref:Cytosine-specific methyltransferase n=1 Tax=uncultured Sulfurovum sp. TaxID=269237 RepID=A0A6S6UIR5_9BACT|nr:MAG: DNA-cytosine methyltransferase (EC [uncultured Sulfurovum sp.]